MREQFINCKQSAGGLRVLEFQFNRPTEVEKDMWYAIDKDFKATEWEKAYDISSEDEKFQGSYRVGQSVTEFAETFSATLSDDIASGFLQALYDITLGGDEYFMEFLQSGLNIRTTVYFAGGAFVRKTYECCAVTNLGAIYEQLKSSDSETELEAVANFQPIVQNVGFSPKLPSSFQGVKATITATLEDVDLTVTISDIIDPNNLVVGGWQVVLYDKETGQVKEEKEGAGSLKFLGLTSGTYLVATAYSEYMDGTTIYYRFINVQEISIP